MQSDRADLTLGEPEKHLAVVVGRRQDRRPDPVALGRARLAHDHRLGRDGRDPVQASKLLADLHRGPTCYIASGDIQETWVPCSRLCHAT